MKKEVIFYSLLDFYQKKETIKDIYALMTLEEKRTYKMYVYSTSFEEEYTKDLIWEFINGWEETLFELSRKYRIKKNREVKRQQLYEKEVENENNNTNETI